MTVELQLSFWPADVWSAGKPQGSFAAADLVAQWQQTSLGQHLQEATRQLYRSFNNSQQLLHGAVELAAGSTMHRSQTYMMTQLVLLYQDFVR